MKTAVFYGKNDIRIEDREIRKPLGSEVTIKTAFCGICGTDLHIFGGDEGSASTVPPIVLGHEFSGVVSEVGGLVKTVKPGDHVAVDPNSYCGVCHYCRSGTEHFCSRMVGVGTTIDGGFAEYCTLPEKAVIPILECMPLETAAFAEPLACCLHGADLSGVRPGNHALVIGAGPIGLLMLQLVKISGASHISVIEPNLQKTELAKGLGADRVFQGPADYFEFAANGSIRADNVFECAGKAETVSLAIRAATKGANVMLFGLTAPDETVELKPFEIFKKELSITSSFVNPYTEPRALSLLSSGRVRVSELIGERVPLEKLPEALAEPSYRNKMKIMVDFNK